MTHKVHLEFMQGAGESAEAINEMACDLFLRLKTVGLCEGNRCDFPLTQVDIADALGVTQPHVSRTISQLNKSGVAIVRREKLEVTDLHKLKKIAAFNSNYLHHLYAG